MVISLRKRYRFESPHCPCNVTGGSFGLPVILPSFLLEPNPPRPDLEQATEISNTRTNATAHRIPPGFGVRQPSGALMLRTCRKRQRAGALQNAGAPFDCTPNGATLGDNFIS